MRTLRFVYWHEDNAWIGYLENYPVYWTQGSTLEDLWEHLCDLYRDLHERRMH